MLEVTCVEEFKDAVGFAAVNGCLSALLSKLHYLDNFGDGRCRCVLSHDFAPHSFGVRMFRPDGQAWFSGGLIYSGEGQALDGSAPAFTVGYPEDAGLRHNWSIHT